jgi:hypothetical protein
MHRQHGDLISLLLLFKNKKSRLKRPDSKLALSMTFFVVQWVFTFKDFGNFFCTTIIYSRVTRLCQGGLGNLYSLSVRGRAFYFLLSVQTGSGTH